MDAQLPDLGPKTWGLVFVLVFFLSYHASRKLAGVCISSQRNRLRDDYEDELRRGGGLTNKLLLPRAQRVAWAPHGPPIRVP